MQRCFVIIFLFGAAASFMLQAADDEVSPSPELDILRGIAVSDRATYADLCNVIMIQRGDFIKYETAIDRCQQLSKEGIYDFSKVKNFYSDALASGPAAKAAINFHVLEKSAMYFLTRLEWYAVQNAESLNILPSRTMPGKILSGAELLGLMEKSALLAGKKASWNNPENPYEIFGVSSYDELNKAYAETTDPGKEKKGR